MNPPPPPAPAHRLLQIGDWCLDPLAHELRRGETCRRLPKRLVRLLLALAAAPGTTLTRDALLSAAWQRRVVGDEVLSRAIAELRHALDDDARAPRYIETLPKTGYRLLAPVLPLPEGKERPSLPGNDDGMRGPRRRTWRSAATIAAPLLAAMALAWVFGAGQIQPPPASWTPAAMVHARPFLSEPEWIRQPRFSRDGHWLAYVSDDGEGDVRVLLAAADGSGARPLDIGAGRPAGPVLSPDATRVAVLVRDNGECVVRIVALPAGGVRDVAACDPRHGPGVEWQPDGRLVYTAPPSADGGSGLWRVDPVDGDRHPLTSPSLAEVADVAPRLAHDGRLAFLRGPSQRQRILLRDGDTERVLVASEDRVTDLAWTPDARHLVVASNRSGYPALHRLDPGTGEMIELGGRSAASLDVAPDGRLVFEQRHYTANLLRYRDGAPAEQLSQSSRYDAWPALSPDDGQLAYVSNREGNGSIFLLDLATRSTRRLDLPDDQPWLRPAWATDGGHLLLTRYADGNAGAPTAWRFGVRDGLLQPSTPARAFATQPLADGTLVYALPARAGKELWLQRVGERPQLLDENVGEFRAAGQHLAWQVRGEPGLHLRNASDARRTSLLTDLDPSQPTTWTLAGDRIVYLAPGPDATPWLWRQPLDGGRRAPWLPIAGAAADSTLAVAGDHSFAIVASIGRIDAALLQVPAPVH